MARLGVGEQQFGQARLGAGLLAGQEVEDNTEVGEPRPLHLRGVAAGGDAQVLPLRQQFRSTCASPPAATPRGRG